MPETITAIGRNGDRLITFDVARDLDCSRYVNNYVGTFNTCSPQLEFKYIKDHDYNPPIFNFHKLNDEEELYLGIELEIDKGGKNDNNANKVINSLGEQNVYCKYDGSLEDGFEIVSHPCTLEYHKNMSYENLFDELSKIGYRSHDVNSCGLHVHFNRNYFAKDKLTQDLCISKLLYLFEKFWEKVVLIARRDSNRYARRFYLSEDETILDMYAKSKNSDKYGVINLQHKNTVEIRIFKGTLNYRTFIATLEFVKTIVELIKNVDIYNIQSVTWDNITSGFSDNLNDYIKEREEIKIKEKEEKKLTLNTNSISGWDTLASYVRCEPVHINTPVYFDTCDVGTYRDTLTRLSSEWNTLSVSSAEQPLTVENMNVSQLRHKISEIQRQINSSRNPMEQQNLRREIQQYSDRISYLRTHRS
jgi:hypothetical protein